MCRASEKYHQKQNMGDPWAAGRICKSEKVAVAGTESDQS
jgi:hypothetical protein